MSMKENIAVKLWALLVVVGGLGRKKTSIAIYGFGKGPLLHILAGKVMMSKWWPSDEKFSS